MTENDKRLTRAHAPLTEGAYAPSQSEGKFDCPGYDHVYQPGHKSNYPAGLVACPSRINSRHHCELDRAREDLNRTDTRIQRLRDLWDTGERDGVWDWLEELYNRRIALTTRITILEAEHRALYDKYEREHARATNKANAESKLGPWEFTLTYSPTEHGWNREEAKDAMRTACERLIRYYREEIEEFHAVGELTTSGQPHVHAWYKMDGGRRITTKSFKRAYPIWDEKRKLGNGHVGGHHAPVKRTSDFAGYIEKDLDTSWLILNITNAPEADVQEAHDSEDEVDQSSQDSTARPPDPPAEPDDGELR